MFSSGPRLYALTSIAPLTALQLTSPTVAGALAVSIGSALGLRELLTRRKP